MSEKRCTKCGETKPKAAFGEQRIRKDGLHPRCRPCNAYSQRLLSHKRIAAGECPLCGKHNSTDYYYCDHCRIRKREDVKRCSQQPKQVAWRREYMKARRRGDIHCRLAHNLRRRLHHALKQNSKCGSAVRDLGCTILELREYLEGQFTSGMSWDSYGCGRNKWNIDHIITLASVDLTKREELLKVCHFSNLRPLWQPDNIRRQFEIKGAPSCL